MEITLFDDMTAHLNDHDRARALKLVESSDLKFEKIDSQSIATQIKDGQTHSVSLGVDDFGALDFQCDCDEFADSYPGPCVHIVAATIAANEEGWLNLSDDAVPEPRPPSAPQNRTDDRKEGKDEFEQGSSGEPSGKYWKGAVKSLRKAEMDLRLHGDASWSQGRELIFLIDAESLRAGHGVVLETMQRDRKRDGAWGKLRASPISRRLADTMPNPNDRQIVSLLVGANAGGYYYDGYSSSSRHLLSPAMAQLLMPMICKTGRCTYSDSPVTTDLKFLTWDEGLAWKLHLTLDADINPGEYVLRGKLMRGEEAMELSEPRFITAGGLIFSKESVALLDDSGSFNWIILLANHEKLRVPLEEAQELMAELNRVPNLPALRLPQELKVLEVQPTMRPRLRLRAPNRKSISPGDRLEGELSFDYDGTVVTAGEFTRGVFDAERNRLVLRDSVAETAAQARLRDLGFRFESESSSAPSVPRLASKNLPKVVKALLLENWHVEADGKLYRRAGSFQVDVTSGIDWFDLSARVDFDGQLVTLPTLLMAMRRGENVVSLGDGTYGLLPEDWLAKYASLASVAKPEEEMLRFSRSQVGLLDALLATHPQSTFDETFRQTRDELRAFEGVVPLDPPVTFVGELRPYQRETLGWFEFLRRFGFGGCLADDMGLGKTVQVLALLESRRTITDRAGPSLVVVPRSLVFNWIQEAARFAPQLRVFDHSGVDRPKGSEHFADYDLVVTTYGTLRRDIIYLKETRFDYVVLDEAQMIKNPNSESAKSVRLLSASHRLVLSGTPVQNHLGDLWSLFEFLNPGMLGAVTVFSSVSSTAGVDADGRALLSRGLRPFVLRRTKEQVASELPARLEQTIYCELEPPQRKLYDELREHYRHSLLGLIEREGINKAKIQILEALLRLRQAACHPGLIDKARADDPSAKLDMLLPRLLEVTQEGHKALIFSQFTQFLALVRKRLDKDNIPYEYLDGRTRDRQERVNHFQTDPNCKLFLISLKAGGLGLNLTAADYVFLLDPWWNPAVEAQAIDRSHRIGQTRQVFACRLIARGTVEEKVLALQQSKRALADAIINADNSLIRTIGRDDLSLLLS